MAQKKKGLSFGGRELVIERGLCRVAHLDADDYKFLDDPEATIAELRGTKARIDLFTFLQKLPDTTPKHAYPIEWDNMAVLPISTYENWRRNQDTTRPILKPFQEESWAIGLRQGDDALLKQVNQFLKDYQARGGFDELGGRYLKDQKEAFRKLGYPFYF